MHTRDAKGPRWVFGSTRMLGLPVGDLGLFASRAAGSGSRACGLLWQLFRSDP